MNACNLMPNTHRRRRCDSTRQLRRVGGVYSTVLGCKNWSEGRTSCRAVEAHIFLLVSLIIMPLNLVDKHAVQMDVVYAQFGF